MKPLSHYLPPLASDFSGVCSLLKDWKIKTILYSPGSCGSVIRNFDKTRTMVQLYSTHFNDLDVTMGTDKLLMDALAADKTKQVAIVGTPVPAFIGTDYNYIEQVVAKDVTAFATDGFEPYVCGVSSALLKLGQKYIQPPSKQRNRVNIIGYSPLALGRLDHLKEAVDVLKTVGLTVQVLGHGMVECASEVQFNWIVAPEGLAVAKWMEERWQIPYLMGLPIGISGMTRWCQQVESLLGKSISYARPQTSCSLGQMQNKRIAIIGEPLTSIELKHCLQHDFSCINISCYAYGLSSQKAQAIYQDNFFKDVCFLANESQIETILTQSDLIVADLLYKTWLDTCNNEAKLLPIPYVALSGMEEGQSYELIGNKGYLYLKNSLEKLFAG